MSSLKDKKSKWEAIKAVGEALVKGCPGFGLASGGVALWLGAAKTVVTMAALAGAGAPMVIGGAAFIAGALIVAKLEKEIERTTPRLSGDILKKLIPGQQPAANAPDAEDLSREFNAGVENVETMKPLRLKSQAEPASGSVMKALRFRQSSDSQSSSS